MVFPVVMYGCVRWTIKKAEKQTINSFKLWCWKRFLRFSWTAKKIKPVNPKRNQHWIFIGRTDAEVDAPILWPRDANIRLIGKDPDTGKDWRQRRMGWQRMPWLDSITDSMDMNLRKLWEIVQDRGAWHAPVHELTKSRIQLSDFWTTMNNTTTKNSQEPDCLAQPGRTHRDA